MPGVPAWAGGCFQALTKKSIRGYTGCMSDNKNMIPEEAVEAAAKVWIGEEAWQDADESWRAEYLDSAREILEAAAPYLMRAGWDEGWEAHGDWGGPTPNPYRRGTHE